MEELLQGFYANSSAPVWSALILGLMTAISPCPLATNITAIGYLGKELENRNRVFLNGIVYTAGRAFSYTSLAFILYISADRLRIPSVFQQYGEKFLGPLLILISLFMLGLIKWKPGKGKWPGRKFEKKETHNFRDAFILGVIFALAFCPYSGVLYFGMLIPMSLQSASGLLLPIVFAVATGIPVILFASLLAYAVSEVGRYYQCIKIFERWFRNIVAVLFLAAGVYYSIVVWVK